MKTSRKLPDDGPPLIPQQAYKDSKTCFINYLATQKVADLNNGKKLLRQAAEAGYYLAQCYLGSLYLHGGFLEKNLEEGQKWLAKADEQKDVAPAEKKAAIYWRPPPPSLFLNHAEDPKVSAPITPGGFIKQSRKRTRASSSLANLLSDERAQLKKKLASSLEKASDEQVNSPQPFTLSL